MKKVFGTALIAGMLATTAASAQEIQPLDTTASSQAGVAAGLGLGGGLSTTAVVVGGFVITSAVVVGVATDGTN